MLFPTLLASHCSNPWRPRPQLHGRSAHIHTSDTGTAATVSAPICSPGPRNCCNFACTWSQDPNSAVVLVLACQTRCQKKSPQLEFTPTGKNKDRESLAVTASIEPNSPATTPLTFHGLGHRRPPCSLHWCWPQLTQLHEDYTTMPCHEPKA